MSRLGAPEEVSPEAVSLQEVSSSLLRPQPEDAGSPRCVAVVLAGGQSRRFGADKLQAPVGDAPLLDRAMEGLPDGASVVVVGPPRALARAVTFVREDPPGGGPAAALVAGVSAALAVGADRIAVLPGDAPRAGHAAALLLEVLAASQSAAVVGTDATGFEQPLQLALRPAAAAALVSAAGPDLARGGSARALVNRLQPPALRHRLPPDASFDIDTPDQLRTWVGRSSASVTAVLAAVDAVGLGSERPVLVALDGRSGVGKSWLAAALALRRPATVVQGDDFYQPRLAALSAPQRDLMPAAEIADTVIDWRRLRAEALEPLLRGESPRFAPYDWQAHDGRLGRPIELRPAELVLVEGVYSARPELADLLDLAVCVQVDEELRGRRLLERNRDREWRDFWQRGEQHYFHQLRPPESFDLQLTLVPRRA